MALLIEEIKKETPFAAFMYKNLVSNMYPDCLEWNKEELKGCLKCIRKNTTGYIEEVGKLFEDYAAFTGKSSKTNPRSLFLSAMDKSPYVKIYKDTSTFDVKYFEFTNKFKELLGKYLPGTNGKLHLQPNSFDVPSTSALSDSMEVVAFEEAPTVPDIHMEEDQTFNTPPPFFPENDNLRSANIQFDRETPQSAGTENLDYTLPPEEQSMDLNCPEDYDPVSEIIQSLGRNQNARDNFIMPGTPYKIHDVCSVKVEGNVVRKLYDEEPQSLSQKQYLLTIVPSY